MAEKKTAVIIGAGPAGLTAALELLRRTDIKPIVLEQTSVIGGISRTVNFKGNRIDIGGHRFFTKSRRVNEFWLGIFPRQCAPASDDIVLNRRLFEPAGGDCAADPEKNDRVMLVRQRITRILSFDKFFDYPVTLSLKTLRGLGALRTLKIGASYLRYSAAPIKPERSLEDFFTNRFGRELYQTFFKDYTQKVWGVPCSEIKPEWGAQRVKGLSIAKTLMHAAGKLVPGFQPRNVETSLIEQFMYPKLGPGQLWERVAELVVEKGGEVRFGSKAVGLELSGGRISSVSVRDAASGAVSVLRPDFVFSTMPVKELFAALPQNQIPPEAAAAAAGLQYRDFLTVGVLAKDLTLKNDTSVRTINNIVPDTWIYIQENYVKMGRLQIYNNWSPYLVGPRGGVWLGVEYFCNEGDEFWSSSDQKLCALAVEELARMKMLRKEDVMDTVVERSLKTYPAYFGAYENFGLARAFADGIDNLFLIGRNGMHRYNNQDHSMLTAMAAVDNIVEGRRDRSNIWKVNTEQDYHETCRTE